MPFERATRVAGRLLLPCLAACAASAPPGPAIDPPDAATAAPVPSPTEAPVAAPEDAGVPRDPIPAPADAIIPRPAACIGSGFDLDVLFAKGAFAVERTADGKFREGTCGCDETETTRLRANAAPDAIAIEVKVDPETAAPGATVKLALTFRNLTPEARTVVFERCEGDAPFSVEAYRGTERADIAFSGFSCGGSARCMPKRVAITLPSGGTATTRGKYAPLVKKQVPPCNEAAVGSLPKGDYTLRLETPLIFQARSDKPTTVRSVEVALRVGR